MNTLPVRLAPNGYTNIPELFPTIVALLLLHPPQVKSDVPRSRFPVTSALPLKDWPHIVLEVAKVVAVVAFPVKFPINEVAFTLPLTSNFSPGVVVPMPTLPPVNMDSAVAAPVPAVFIILKSILVFFAPA